MTDPSDREEDPPRPERAVPRIVRVETFVHRAPIDPPVVTAFGRMADRPSLTVRLTDAEGASGWGEVWCNFPACGAEHRARLVETVLAPRLLAAPIGTPRAWTRARAAELRILALQTGEDGPLAQALAGLDIALWDLAARRAGRPLRRLLAGAAARDEIPVYASGINPDSPVETVARCRAAGHDAFKIKIGFGLDRDVTNATAVASALGSGETYMVDANQGFDVAAARRFAAALDGPPPAWLEEPLPADAADADWTAVARLGLPLAAGENARDPAGFDRLIAADWLSVLQPDICKWGGVTGVIPVARAALAAGKTYCPHYLGGGVGLAASAEALAAVGGDGRLEIDANPNPLRERVVPAPARVRAGRIALDDAPGLGRAPDLDGLRDWLARYRDLRDGGADAG